MKMKLKTDRTIKNIVVIAVVFIVMSVGVSSLYNAIARKMINDEVLKMVEADSGDMTKKFDRIIGEVDQISRYLLIDMDVQNYILTGKTTSVIGNLRTNMENKISAYRYVYDYIHSINICSDESVDKYFDGMNESTIAGEKPLWKEAYDNCIGSCLLTRKKDNAYPIIMTFIRKTTLQGKSGGIIINIDLNNLSEILGDGNSEYQKRYIIDDEGNIVYKYKRI